MLKRNLSVLMLGLALSACATQPGQEAQQRYQEWSKETEAVNVFSVYKLFSNENGMLDPRKTCQGFDLKTQPDEAVKCYEKVAHASPNSSDAQYFLGVAYVWAGDEKSTYKQYQVIRKMENESAYLLIDVIYHVKPEWINDYYEKEANRFLIIEKRRLSRIKQKEELEKLQEVQRLLNTLGYKAGPSDGVVRPKLQTAIRAFQKDAKLLNDGQVSDSLLMELRIQAGEEIESDPHGLNEDWIRSLRVPQEMENLKYAKDALSRDELESVYRLLEDGFVSDYEEVKRKYLDYLEQHPELFEAAQYTFSAKSLKESIGEYGESAREIERQRLSIYKTVASEADYLKARKNFESVFGALR